MKKSYDLKTKLVGEPLQNSSQTGDHCTLKIFKDAKTHWLPLLLTVALSLFLGQAWAQTVTVGPIILENGSTWTVPAGTTEVTFEAIGGGGGGGNATNTKTGCGGGGGGAYAKNTLTGTNFNVGTIFNITVGTGGTGGNDGGNSIVTKGTETILRAAGGKKGTNNSTAGGAGGSDCYPSDGAHSGGEGGTGAQNSINDRNRSGGGGGAAGPSQNGGDGGDASNSMYGSSGSAGTGRDPGGNGGAGVGAGNKGNSGAEYGGGGSGAARGGSGSYTGGSGADGVVMVTYKYTISTVTLNANGGNAGKLSSFKAIYNAEYGSPINSALYKPSKDGCEFLGWFTDPTNGTKVEPTSICNSETVTLYAHWRQYTNDDLLVKGMQTFETGNNSWTAPLGTWKITNIELWGGGAGGGSVTDRYQVGSGGGGGAYLQSSMTTPNNYASMPFSITVAAQANAATDGNPSSVQGAGQTFTANGGNKGTNIFRSYPEVTADGGQGGTAIGGLSGEQGGAVSITYSNGYNYSPSGAGGAGANGGAGGASVTTTPTGGNAGQLPGGGGSGARNADQRNTSNAGGAGAAGFVAIEYEILKLKVSRNLNYTDCVNPADTTILYYTDYTLGTPSRPGYGFVGWFNADGQPFAMEDTYSYTNDTVLYAHWDIDPGEIATGSTTILPCGNFNISSANPAATPSSYKWIYNKDDADQWDTIEGATAATLSQADLALTESGTYVIKRVAVSTATGNRILSRGEYTVTVREIAAGTISTSNTEIISRTAYTITSSGNDANVTNYKWGYKHSGEERGYTIIAGATGANLTQADFALVAPGVYEFVRYTYINDCKEVPSNTVTITVKLDGAEVCFETPGNTTWQAPEGTWKVTLQAWGGGGAGGNATTNRSVGSGGGGGGYLQQAVAEQNFSANTFAIIVGQGGIANRDGSTAGGDSKVTFEETTWTAGGGQPGTYTTRPNSGTSTNPGGTGGAVNGIISGEQGGSATAVRRPESYTAGSGGKGAGANGGAGGIAPTSNGSGISGTPPGGGGSGARNSNNSSSNNYGGAGGNGKVCISYEILKLQLTTNVNYGGAASQTNMVLYYDTLPVPNPTRPDYEFDGWYDAPTGGNLVEFEKSGNVYLYNHTEDLNLYAHWRITPGRIATGNSTILPCGEFAVSQDSAATPGSTYKWFYTKDNGAGKFIVGAAGNTLSQSDITLSEIGTYVFHRVALNAETGDSLVSRGAYTVTVRDINGGTIAANPATIYPAQSYSITSSVAETGDNISYSWAYKKTTAENYTTIAGATTASLTSNQPTLDTEATYQFIRYTKLNSCREAEVASSNVVSIQVRIVPGSISGSTTIIPCGAFSIASATDAQGQSSYKWIYKATSASQWDTIQGAAAAALAEGALTLSTPGTYTIKRLAVNNVGGTHEANGSFTITVRNIDGGTIAANPATITPRASYAVTNSTKDPVVTNYRWAYKNSSDAQYTEIDGATGEDLTNAPALVALGDYQFIRYTYMTGCGASNIESASSPVTITVALESYEVCFETPGNTTWPAPEGTWKITSIEAWGGGGAGGNVATLYQAGSGGGGGAYLQTAITNPQYFHNTPFTIKVGQGGQSGDTPTDGGDSEVTFSENTWTAGGGKHGEQASYGNNKNGGQGGTPSVGNQRGGNGGNATYNSAGAGGAGANGGAGGIAPTSNGVGQSGAAPGGGGSGAYISNQRNTSYSGGAGAAGKVCITYEILELQVVTNANYGGAVNDTNLVLYYDTLPVANPTREGYLFTGWYDAPTGGNLVEFDSTGNYALYNKTQDMNLYAGWKVGPGSIDENTGAKVICCNTNYTITGTVPQAQNITYSWKCTKWLNDGTYSIHPINVSQANLTQANFALTEPGLYEFARFVDANDGQGPQQSDNTFRINAVNPIDTVGGLVSNYYKICDGGMVELTVDTDLANITMPDINNPSQNTTLTPNDVSYEYSVAGSNWQPFENGVTPLNLSASTSFQLRAVYSYLNLGCVALSKPITVEVVQDPEFNEPYITASAEEICPDGTVTLTAGELSEPEIENNPPYHYTWKVYSNGEDEFVEVGDEATYSYEDSGRVAHVNNFLLTEDTYNDDYPFLTYSVVAENALGCSAQSAADINTGDMVEIYVTKVLPPVVSNNNKAIFCPQEGTFTFNTNVTADDDLVWYADATTTEKSETPSNSLAAEDTVVWYVAQTDGSCISARVPDTLVVRYTAHIARTSEPAILNQEICQFNPLDNITFSFDGNAYPVAIGLPAGVNAVTDSLAHTFTISGAPTMDGIFPFTVKLQDGPNPEDCSQPTVFEGTITVNPSPHTTVYFTSCDHETVTIGTGAEAQTFNTPGTYTVPLHSSSACDSVVTLIYTESFFNKFGYYENEELLAGWTNFSSVASPINSDVNSGVYINSSSISYSGWNGSNATRDNLESTSSFITASGSSLGLLNGSSREINNGQSIVLKTSTKGYDKVNLHFDYGAERFQDFIFGIWSNNDIAFSKVLFAYSLDGVNYVALPDQLLVNIGEQDLTTGSYGMNFKDLLSDNVLADKNDIYIKLTFDGAGRTIAPEYFRLDNIAFTGVKAIDTIGIVKSGSDTVCTNAEVTLVATAPFINEEAYPVDTTRVTYTWERIKGGVTDTLQQGATYNDHILVDAQTDLEQGWYQYVVSVGKNECLLSDTMDIYRLKPYYHEQDTVRGVVCSNRINSITDIEFLNGFTYKEGMAIVETSMEELAVPGVHCCKLSMPNDDNQCGEIVTLELNVKRAFDTTIVENICLGETYHKYGIEYTPEEEGITYHMSPSGWTCANGCDSIYRITLITNSVLSTITDQHNITLVEWDMAKGKNNFKPTNGVRAQNATFVVNTPGNVPSFENVTGHTPSDDYSYTEENGALMWPNLSSTCSAAFTAASATEYQGVYFEIALNPKDYTNLKAKFDYKRENATTNNAQAFDNVNYSYKIGEGGSYSTPQSQAISSTDWSTVAFDFSDANTQDEDVVYLKFEFTGGNIGASENCGSGLAALVSGSRYWPSYITIDNMKVWGDKPARAELLTGVPTATYIPTGESEETTVSYGNEISICRDKEVTFTSQVDDDYFTFYVQDPNGVDTAFDGNATMTIKPQVTGTYYVVARDNNGCDSLFAFPIVVNEYAVIANCTAPYICSGAALAFAPSDAPARTTYTWLAPTHEQIEFSTLKSGDEQDSLRAQLKSASEDIVSVIYTMVPSTDGCEGTPFTITVNVLPEVTSMVISPVEAVDTCPGTSIACQIKFEHIKYNNLTNKDLQVVWNFNESSDTAWNHTAFDWSPTHSVTLPKTPCDTTYNLYATYTDGAGCVARDTIKLSVGIPAHSFEIAEADNDSTVYCLADANEPLSTLVPEAYSGCGDTLTGVLVGTYVDSPATITCEGTRTYTYKYTDCAGQDTTWKYVYTISHKAPEKKPDAVWPSDSVNQPRIFADADTSCLYSDDQVKALYQDNCGGNGIIVTHIQVANATENCGWKYTRTYTIATACGDTVTPKPTMSVSGNDQSAPTYTRPANTVAYLQLDGTVDADTSKTGVPTNVSDNSGNKCDTTYRDEPYTYACDITFNRIWRVKDACGNVSTSDSIQVITVKDTLTPHISGNWADSIVYLAAYNACGYTLPDTLKTVAQVNGLKAGFIKGQNLNPQITMMQDTSNKGGCDMSITRTYTVTDTCSNKSATFTHKISIKDTTKPVLAAVWPDDIEGQNHIYAEADTSGLYTDDQVKALFNDCHDITVTHTQVPTLVSNCGWTIARTYHIEDACGNGFDSTMSVSGANQNAPMLLVGTWPSGASDVNSCLTNPDTTSLKADTAIAKLFSDTCGVYVSHKDSIVVGSTDCHWTIIRTYFVKDSCDNFVTPNPTMTVTGGDTSKPTFTCPAPLTLYRTADCTFDADTSTTHSVPTGISDNCTEIANLTAVFADDTVAGACNAAITINRTWTVTDACNNVGQKVQVITILDSITPKMLDTATWIAELDTQKNCARSADTSVFYTDAQVKAKFYDNCSAAVIVTHTQRFEEDGECYWNAFRTYTIADSCGNTTTRTQKLPGSAIDDPLAPTLIVADSWPADVTGEDNCFANADTSLLYNDLEMAALFEDECSVVILVSHEDDTVSSADNGWEIKRTYTIKDGCGNIYSAGNLPTMSLSGADGSAPTMKPDSVWPEDIAGVTGCPGTTDTTALLSDSIVKTLFTDCGEITVSHVNETFDVEGGNCGWQIKRTYTITDACNNSLDTAISIFGTMEGDGAAPTRNPALDWPENITGQDNCFANADTTGLYSNAQIAALFTNDCSGVVVTHVDDITSQTSNCGWAITRTYTVKDVCGNAATGGPYTMSVSGSDQTAPALSGTWPSDSNNINKSLADIPAGPTKAAIKSLFTDCSTITVDSVRNVTGTDCNWTAEFCYEIKDECNNTVKDTVTFTGGDYEKPKFVCPKDTILNLAVDGTVDATPDATGVPTDVTDNYTPLANMTITHTDKDTVVICGNTFKFSREWHVSDTCDNDSVKVQTITVGDTMAPTIAARNWDDSTVYWTLDTTYTLPTAFATIAEVNAVVANFITGNNLVPTLAVKADTLNKNTCDMYVVRTYTVTDSCNGKDSSFTHTIHIEDTLTPRINGTWADSTVYLTATGTYTLPNAYTTVSQLNTLNPNFVQGSNLNSSITLEADTINKGTCGMHVIRTYTITDSCSHKTDTFKHKINVNDTITPRISGTAKNDTVYMASNGAYTLPTQFSQYANVTGIMVMGNNIAANIVMTQADTTGEGTCGLQVVRTYKVTDTCNNKINTFTHTIVVRDTVKPVIAARNWDDSTVYWTLDTTYTLPTAFATIAEVNAVVANFITGNNLVPTLAVKADTLNKNTCDMYVVRTYTVTDSCNGKDSSFTHTIHIEDTLTPRINGTWADSTVYLTATGTYTLPNAYTTVSQLNTLNPNFVQGPNLNSSITVEADTNNQNTCDWNVVRTYTVTDSCSHKSATFTHTFAVKDTMKPVLAAGKVWLKDSLNQNKLLTEAYIVPLADNDSVKKLFFDCTNLTVTHNDDTLSNSNCGWKIRRTYTITDACGNKKVDSVFVGGGDQTKPTYVTPKDTVLYLSADCGFDTTTASTLTPTDVADNSGVTPTVTYVNETAVSDCGNTFHFTRTWHVVDACGNDSISKQLITVKDTSKPVITGTLTNDTVYLAGHSCDAYTLTEGLTTVGDALAHRGNLSITDCNVSDDTPVLSVTPDEHGQGTCDHYFVRTYTVMDSCYNSRFFTHKIVVMDTLTPSIAGNWADSTVQMDATGHYDLPAVFTSVAALNALRADFIQNCNINDRIELVEADTTGEGTCGLQVVRTYKVTDSCSGKSKTFTHTIKVADTVKPVINCKDVAQEHATDLNKNTFKQNVTDWDVSASDNNAIDTIYYHLSGATVGEGANTLNGVTFNTGKTLVTWTVTDVCGNNTTCTDTVKIINVNQITVYISENTDTVTYDGQEHSLTGYHVDSISNELYTTADFRLKPSASNDSIVKGTLAGSYSMNLDQNDFENVSPYFTNIRFEITDNNFVIKKNPATITIASGSHTFDASEYDGQPHYFPSYVVTYNGVAVPRTVQDSTKFVLPTGDTLSVTPTGYVVDARETAEHNNTFTWTLQHADCYANEIDTNGLVGTIHFNAFPQPIVITSETMTWTYDGNEHSYPKYTVKFGDDYATRVADDTTKFILPISGDTVRIQSTASITNAGKVANTFTYTIDNDAMYVGERDTIIDTLYVLPLGGVVVTITENTDTVTYDGTTHSVTGYEVTNISSDLYSTDYFTYGGQISDSTASGIYAGTYPMNVLSADFTNTSTNFTGVTFTIVDRDLVVKPIESNIQITANSAEKNFDGTPLTEAGYTHTMTGALVTGDTIVAVVSGSQTEVGSSANVVTAYYVLRKTSATTFDTITNCYTFATPATVNGTLLVNKALAIVSKDSVDVDCYGNHNGTATIVVEGGKLESGMYAYAVAGPNSYSVNGNVGSTLELTGLYPGSYTVSFTDGLDSTVTTSFYINEPDALVAEVTAPTALCPNQGSYPVSVTVTGGNGNNAYVWGSNATNVNATSTVVAQINASDCGYEYTAAVQVTDAKGCVAKDTVKFTVVDNDAPSFTVPVDITLCRNADGAIDAPTSETGVPTNYSDNCSNEATMIRHTTFRDIDTTGNINTRMVIRREWTVKDSCGNSIADTQRISIKPSIAGSAYELTAPADIEVTLRYGAVDTLIANIGQATASHIPEGIAAPQITNNKPANNRYSEGINYVVWTATDECGFTVVDTQTITVKYPLCESVTYYGHEYPAVRLAGNCWLAENLRNTQYADGAAVPNYSSYNNDNNMIADYGLLYSWYSAVRVTEGDDNAAPSTIANGYVQGLCPEGWAIPKQSDFASLYNTAGNTEVLRDQNVQYWLPGAAGVAPNAGFNARGAGYYDASVDRYMNMLGETYFWTSTNTTVESYCVTAGIKYFCTQMLFEDQDKGAGFSVRCIRKQ